MDPAAAESASDEPASDVETAGLRQRRHHVDLLERGHRANLLAHLRDQLGLQLLRRSARDHAAAVEETFVNKDATATLKLGQARGKGKCPRERPRFGLPPKG